MFFPNAGKKGASPGGKGAGKDTCGKGPWPPADNALGGSLIPRPEMDIKRPRLGPGPEMLGDPLQPMPEGTGAWGEQEDGDASRGPANYSLPSSKVPSPVWNGGPKEPAAPGLLPNGPQGWPQPGDLSQSLRPPFSSSPVPPQGQVLQMPTFPASGVGLQQGQARMPPPPPPPPGPFGQMDGATAPCGLWPDSNSMPVQPQLLPPQQGSVPQQFTSIQPPQSVPIKQQQQQQQQQQPPPPMIPSLQGPGVPLPVPIFLAPATKHIMPRSSRTPGPGTSPQPQGQAPAPGAPPPAGGSQESTKISMKFLNADRETQTKMLGDPLVARAILQTLGGSVPRPGGAAPGTAPTGGSPATAPAAAPQAAPGQTGQATQPAAGNASTAASGAQAQTGGRPAWAGRIVLTRSQGKPLSAHASLLDGKVASVELVLRCMAQCGSALNITHRVPFDDLARRAPSAVLALAPTSQQEQQSYDEYCRYFRAKMRAGVAHLDNVDALYIVPPSPEAAPLIQSLQAAGVTNLPANALLAVVAPSPTARSGPAPATDQPAAPATVAAPARQPASQPATRPAAATAATGAAPEKASTGEAAAKSIGAQAAGGRATSAGAKAAAAETAPKAETREATEASKASTGAEDAGQEISGQALLDLFSNPDLIASLQDDAGDGHEAAD